MRTLVVLTRAPVAGAGKTRLRAELDGLAVDRLVRAFLLDTVSWPQRLGARLLLAHHGPFEAAMVAGQVSVVPQPSGDLGARIDAALEAAFERGADRAVIVGSDSPTLPLTRLRRCFTDLDAHAATLIPAVDGGWVALGVREPLRGCLAGVRWSRSDTAMQTVAALEAQCRDTAVLKPWYDVDCAISLHRLRVDLARAPEVAPHTVAVVRGL